MESKIAVVNAIWHAILNDDWMWTVVWGKNRTGKSTLALQLSYVVYRDWDKVLDSLVFTLNDFFHKLKTGKPEVRPTKGGFNERVPLLIWDDMAVHLNKAATRHDFSVDFFKGYFQAAATDLAVLIGTMLVPTGVTFQLNELMTHELFLPERGIYKFDESSWMPNYYGWRPNPQKRWIETNKFKSVPEDVYREYNEMRRALTEEAKEKVMDKLSENIPFIIKRLKPQDFEVLQTVRDKGRMHHGYLLGPYADGPLIRARLKSRGLITGMRRKNHTYYDITDLGIEVLETAKKERLEKVLVHA